MIIIGALVCVEAALAGAVHCRLTAMPGVTPFSLGDPARIGLLIEAATLDGGYRLLQHDIREDIEGVVAVWPVYAHFGAEDVGEKTGQPSSHSLVVR